MFGQLAPCLILKESDMSIIEVQNLQEFNVFIQAIILLGFSH